ncbi:MAG TPA: DASS family sodium-coupled anion symporter [Vicinamibacterales bacterium]|nr:DASS family sodium-coupled anion symporter [Vicinamibacterales bacterium]
MSCLTARALGHVLLLLLPIALAWLLDRAGWSREQVFAAAILAATALLWVTEALPLFATAFISIAAQMFFLANPAEWPGLGFEQGNGPEPRAFLAAAADPVLVLFFGGLVLSRAISKTGVDRRIAALVLRPMVATPARMLLGVMLTTAGFSMLMSNTATTALMLALIVPILLQLPRGDPFRKAIILAVPLSANIAGMATPIASPPNAIAVSYLARAGIAIGFVQWMLAAIPLVLVLLIVMWRWLLRCYPPTAVSWRLDFPEARLSPTGAWVIAVALITITVWMTEPWHGVPASVAAVLPVIFLFTTSVITREDVNTLDWDVLILIAGGLSLGYSLQVTAVDERLAAVIPVNASDAARLGLVALATFVLGTFFSNTAIASMLMPVAAIAASTGASGLDLTAYALTIALVASLSMALPVSTPPNAMAHGTGEVTRSDFLQTAGSIGLAGAALVVLAFAFVR